MLRKQLKSGVASALHWARMDNWFGSYCGVSSMPLVLCYHRVVRDFQASATRSISPMLVSVRTLERQLDWIGRKYDFVSLDDLAICQERNIRLRKPVAAITFDDGYQDVYENGYPLLRRKGIPFAIFVVTDHVNTNRVHLHDKLYRNISIALSKVPNHRDALRDILHQQLLAPSLLARMAKSENNPFLFTRLCLENLCKQDLQKITDALDEVIDEPESSEFNSATWDMLSEMARNDVTVGSHTSSHALLVNETPQRVLDEVHSSRLAAEKMLGLPVRHFAYPDGRFNRDVVQAVDQAGYLCAYTTCYHRDRSYARLTIPRRVMWEYSGTDADCRFSPAMMSCQVNGVFDLVSKCSQAHGI